jgi:S-adenosylmethionine:tRNA ribosyltransferase-isomerase
MLVDAFDFSLPDELIALRPVEPRDACRLLIVHGDGRLEHRRFTDIADYLGRADMLLLNDTRVIPARLRGVREGRGMVVKVELLLHRRLDANRFEAMARPMRRLQAGDHLWLDASLGARVIARRGESMLEIAFDIGSSELDEALAAHGEMPLPPYIAGKRRADSRDQYDYQTIYAEQDGSVAAPTAGLHFTSALLSQLAAAGVEQVRGTLHVGLGTFLPVKVEDTRNHQMHQEWGELSASAAARLNQTRAEGGRVVAVGTTSLRLLETATGVDGTIRAFRGETDIFITPGYRFRAADALVTNFHLPRSTLFMLVSAMIGLDVMKAAYAEAIRERYRFYSYGDACLLLPHHG